MVREIGSRPVGIFPLCPPSAPSNSRPIGAIRWWLGGGLAPSQNIYLAST